MAPKDNNPIIHFLYNNAFHKEALRSVPPPLREACIFAEVLANLPIAIPQAATIAGDFGWVALDPDQTAAIEQAIESANAAASSPAPTAGEQCAEKMLERFHCFGIYCKAHTCPDYAYLFSMGFDGLLRQAARQRAAASGEQAVFLDAMIIALQAVVNFASRYAVLAEKLAAQCSDTVRKHQLQTIAFTCQHIPLHRPQTFHEALQFIWFVHIAIGVSELSSSSLSFGRLDQILYPFYQQELQRHTEQSDIEALLREFFCKLNGFGDPACNINLGGTDARGNDQFNPLSHLMLQVVKTNHLPAPLLAVRVHRNLPHDVFDSVLDPDLLRMGQPAFYGEQPCRQALAYRGVPQEDIDNWVANSCMGLFIPGKEISNMWASVINLLLPLELAMNQGHPFAHDLPMVLKTPAPDHYDTFEAFYQTALSFADELLDYCIKRSQHDTLRCGREQPNPFLTAIGNDGIALAKDRALGGVPYHTAIVETFGLVNFADALTVIYHLVFETGTYALSDLTQAAKRNFVDDPALFSRIKSIPKFGNDDPRADAMAARVARDIAARIRAIRHDTIQYLPSFHTLTAHIPAGKKTAASLDGRRAAEPLAKNMGTTPGRQRQNHTALMKSAAAINQIEFNGGQALDISIDLNILKTPEGVQKLQQLFTTYFQMGGLQLQVNALSAEHLKKALERPQDHTDLIVKIAGYCDRFVNLSRDTQLEMIDRFYHGL